MSFDRVRAVCRWLAGCAPPLSAVGGTVVALSPHLDDAVFSLGAALAHAARHRAVTIVTVFAGDPTSREPAGTWDACAGFRTAGEAAAARRREDERACALLRVRSRWLPYTDSQYERTFADDDLIPALEPELENATLVLVPGFPLEHPDHALLNSLVVELVPAERIVLYAEQPYTLWANAHPPGDWIPVRATLPDRVRKIRACGAYASQLPLFGGTNVPTRVARHEAARGGELIRPAS